jgi:hypothetical protein
VIRVAVSSTTSIQDLHSYELNIYPNPANDKIKIDLKYANQSAVIQNTIGKHIKTISIPSNGLIDVSSLSDGLYFLILSKENICKSFVVGR